MKINERGIVKDILMLVILMRTRTRTSVAMTHHGFGSAWRRLGR